jgi:protoporphyrinogen oxidase
MGTPRAESAGGGVPRVAILQVAGQGHTDTAPVDLDDDALFAAVYADLDTAFPGASERVTGTHIQRLRYAYPVMPPSSFARLRALAAALKTDSTSRARNGYGCPSIDPHTPDLDQPCAYSF